MTECGQEHEINNESERCVYCGARVQYWPNAQEWVHASGARYCQKHGFTRTPLQVATPTYHPKGAVL